MTYEEYIYYPTSKTNGILVHKNKLNIMDKNSLKLAEKDLTTARIKDLSNYPKGNFDIKHFKAFNKYLFGDLYEWAGEFKKWNLGKGQSILGGYSVRYCPPEYVESCLNDCSLKLQTFNPNNKTTKEIANEIADIWSYFWQTHPFYEGNTRTTALIMTSYLRNKEIPFDMNIMARYYHDFRNALVLASAGKEDKLNILIEEGLKGDVLNRKIEIDHRLELLGNL